MIPSIVITLHVAAGHIVPAHIVIPHVMSAARYHQLYGSASILNWAAAIPVLAVTAVTSAAIATVASALTRLWKRTA